MDLELSLPTEDDLRPAHMETITVLATSPEITPRANRSVINGDSFSAGDLPVADDVQISVLLNDASNKLVGLGEAAELVDIVGDESTKLRIPVRKPFVYASSGTALYTFDPTLDPRVPNSKFQGQLAGLGMPRVAISVGGDRLVVGGGNQLQVVDTATHRVIGNAIALSATVNDAAPVPGQRRVAVATSAGIAIVDVDTGAVANADVGPVDRVTVGPVDDSPDARMVAYGLVGRVLPPDLPPVLTACSGASSIVAVFVDSPAPSQPKPLQVAVSGIAAAPSQPAVFATLPCQGQIARVEGDPTTEVGQLALANLTPLPYAAAITVLGDRVYAAGSTPSEPDCGTACTTMSSTACPETTSNRVSHVGVGARLQIKSIPITGGNAATVELPERRQSLIDEEDPAEQHAQVLHPIGAVPIDMVALPGGQFVSVVMRNSYYISSLIDQGTGIVILPCLKATTADWMLVDLANSSVAARVRTYCMKTAMRPGALFSSWQCEAATAEEQNKQGADYLPVSVGALFGAR